MSEIYGVKKCHDSSCTADREITTYLNFVYFQIAIIELKQSEEHYE